MAKVLNIPGSFQPHGRRFAKVRPRSERGTMNKTEARYALELDVQKQAGLILDYAFDKVTLRLAKLTSFTPDFMVTLANGELCFRDVKGRKGDSFLCEEDAKVKIKCAAEMFPQFHFEIVWERKKADGGGWKMKSFSD